MNRSFLCIILFYLFLSGYTCMGQKDDLKRNFLEVQTENDVYFLRLPTDRYFTSGFNVLLQNDQFEKGILGFGKLLPFQLRSKKAHNYYQLGFTHQLYTPFDIEWNMAEQLDRPYAALAILKLRNHSILREQGISLKKEFQLGWVGPAIPGEVFQSELHRLVGRPLAQAWQYQIDNMLILGFELEVEKTLGQLNKGQSNTSNFQFLGKALISNLQSHFQAGIRYNLGHSKVFSRTHTLEISTKLNWFFYIDLSTRAVAFNQLIEGDLQEQEGSEQIDIQAIHHLILVGAYGFVIRKNQWQLSLSQHALSPEVKEGSAHFWGSIALRRYW